MDDWLMRQSMLIGADATHTLQKARVAVIGVGGVGGAALEAIARCGVRNIFVMDYDVFEASNLNRQLLAFCDTIGAPKVDIAALRVRSINPEAQVAAYNEKFCADSAGILFRFKPDYVIDAIDMVSAKLELIAQCKAHHVPVISCMGTGNRLDASAFHVGDIEETAGCGCPLARVMRRELRKREIADVTVLYSTAEPRSSSADGTPGSISFVPPVAGYLLAGHVIRSLLVTK